MTLAKSATAAAFAAMVLAFALNGCGDGKKGEAKAVAGFFPIDVAQIQFGADIETVKKTFGIKRLEAAKVRFVFRDNVLETNEFGRTVQFGFSENKLAEVHIKFPCDSSEILEKNIMQLCNDNLIQNTQGYCQESKWNYNGKSFIMQRTCCGATLDNNYQYEAAHIYIYSENPETLSLLDTNLTWDINIQTAQQIFKHWKIIETPSDEKDSLAPVTLYFSQGKLIKVESNGEFPITFYNPNANKGDL